MVRYLAAADPDVSVHEDSKTAAQSRTVSAASTNITGESSKLDKLFEMLGIYEERFLSLLRTLLEALNYLAATETAVFLNLCAKLSHAGDGLNENST